MYQKVLTPRANPVITPSRLASFGRFDLPQQYVTGSSPLVQTDDYTNLQTYIDAATNQVETCAATACLNEQVLLTLDFFPNTQDPRNFLQYELSYSYAITPWWWWGFPTKDSIELVHRPVLVPTLATGLAVTAVSVANNVVTVTCNNSGGSIAQGAVVQLAGTAEGNVSQPQSSTVPFLNGVPLTVLTATTTQFTAAFTNFYQITNGQPVAQSYTNNSDTGTVSVVSNPLIITYNDANGVLQTWSSLYYTVQYDKICLNVGSWWPNTDRRQDCIQISYWAGNATTAASVDSRLQMAIMYLANHMWQVRDIISVEPTSEIGKTLCLMLSSFRSYRIPR